jgi:ubiquinone/menaquinone biosynthesis C-methylase UbiE
LELGAGSGLNFPHYPATVSELVLTEPEPFMLRHLRPLVDAGHPQLDRIELVAAPAERLPFEDASFDTVVTGCVLCTVEDPDAALGEIARVLRASGRYLFLEHVRDHDPNSRLATWQDRLERPWHYVAAGCHPNRRTEELLERSPREVARRARRRPRRAVPLVAPCICGVAVPRS